MFGAGTNAGSRTDEEIFYQDFKRFTAANVHFGVGQTMVMSRDAQYQLKERLLAYMKTQHSEADMLFFMITNVLDESTLLLFAGTRAREVISESFDGDMGDGAIYLPGVVSRKKQMVPQIMAALQQ